MAKSGIEARQKAALEEGGAAYIARRDEIIPAAARVFRECGFDAATLRDIADALNTDRASLYYYIGSEEELLQEIVRDVLARDLRAAEAIKRSRASRSCSGRARRASRCPPRYSTSSAPAAAFSAANSERSAVASSRSDTSALTIRSRRRRRTTSAAPCGARRSRRADPAVRGRARATST